MNWNICEDSYPGPAVEVKLHTLYRLYGTLGTMSPFDSYGIRRFTFISDRRPPYNITGEDARLVEIDPFVTLFEGVVEKLEYDYRHTLLNDPKVKITLAGTTVGSLLDRQVRSGV